MQKQSLPEFIKKYGIGLTGGVATGKSTVAKMLQSRSFPVIDADELARLAVRPATACLNTIVDKFGPGVLSPDGTLNRKAVADIVFKDPGQRKVLESITHPEIQRLFLEKIRELGLPDKKTFFFYEAALLIESGRAELFAQIWVTFCSPETQIQRLKQARKLDDASAQALLGSQIPAIEKAINATVVINTDCGLPEVELQVANAVRTLHQS